MPPPMSASLAEQELARAVAAALPGERLLAVCRAWALWPAVELGALAVVLGRGLPGAGVGGANQAQREAAWQALAGQHEPAHLEALLATPWSRRPADAEARLAALERFPRDPRIVAALLELDSGARYLSAAGNRFWLRVYRLLLTWGSSVAAERVARQRAPGSAAHPAAAVRARQIFEPLWLEWLDRLPTAPSLTPTMRGAVEALAVQGRAGTDAAEALLRAAHEAPGDDAPRQVLADALTERGDPRGEFLSLQFAQARGEATMAQVEHARRLLAASGTRWFDGLQGQVAPRAVFRRGLLAEVQLATRTPDPTCAAWRTVEVLDCGGLALSLADFLRHPNLSSVRALRSLRGDSFAALAREGRGLRLGLVEVGSLTVRGAGPPAFLLEALRLRAPAEEALAWLAATGVEAPELQLELPAAHPQRLGGVAAAAEARLPATTALAFAAGAPGWPQAWVGAWSLALRRAGPGARFTEAAVTLARDDARGLEAALASLAALALEALSVRVVARQGPAWREATQRLLDRATQGWTALSRRDVQLARPHPLPRAGLVSDG